MLKTKRAQFLVDWLNLPHATGVDDARWEHFQLDHLQDNGTFRIEAKSRQIAWSWLVAAESVADAMLNGNDSIYVSINLAEAQEKIRYAKRITETLYEAPISGLPKLTRDNDLALEFDNGARLNSLPARPPRGRARANVYLDEFAHVQWDHKIYTAALPVISKGGRLRIGSSPLGASGTFWEVFGESLRQYPGYNRKRTPWWEVQAFCTNVAHARAVAPTLTTEERVELFGNDRIRIIFENMPLEDFQQEYECSFADQSTSWIAWEEIAANQTGVHCQIASAAERNIDAALAAIDALCVDVQAGRVESVLAMGVDVGRTRNTTELFAVGLSTTDSYPLRLMVTLDNMGFNEQKTVMGYALEQLPISKMYIDRNGIGMNLAEDLEREYPVKVEGAQFTQASKVLWATDAKMLIQQRRTPLPTHRDLSYQIHSVKRIVSASKNLIFDTERNEKHHADKFWAWALALAASKQNVGITERELNDAVRWW